MLVALGFGIDAVGLRTPGSIRRFVVVGYPCRHAYVLRRQHRGFITNAEHLGGSHFVS